MLEVGWQRRVEHGQRLLTSAEHLVPLSRRCSSTARLLLCSNRGACVRALVFINPGNPTGQCLTEVRGMGAWYQCARLLPCPSVRATPERPTAPLSPPSC